MTTTQRAAAPRRRRKRSDFRIALLFLLPLAVIYLVYYFYSIVFLAQTSTTRVGIAMRNAVDVGWQNFENLLTDEVFLRSIVNNFVFGIISIAVAVTVAFFIAVALATGVRAKKLFYLVFLLPALIPVSLVATVFGAMFQERFGIVNETLRGIGLGSLAQPWLTEPGWAFAVVACLFAYLIGLPVMYYTADLAALPTESLEAALLDGAGTFRIMRSIIYPMMGATHLTVILSLLLGSFRALEQVLFSTGGGPGNVTEITGTYLYSYTNSGGKTIGFVSAASLIVLVIALIISVVQMVVDRRARRIK